jgi:hypothetical protein
MMTDREIRFIREHLSEDIHGLALGKHNYPGIDVPKCLLQIEGLRKIKNKVPEWYACTQVFIPSTQAAEQASSAETARYKWRFLKEPGTVVDMTGGLGVDAYYFAATNKHVVYAEQDAGLCRAASHNFRVLGAGDRIQVMQADAQRLWDPGNRLPDADLVYADPSRRTAAGTRIRGIAGYSPDVTRLATTVLKQAPVFLIKISPLEDIVHTLRLFPQTSEIHVLSRENECKELLFLLKREKKAEASPLLVCSGGFSFRLQEEQQAAATVSRERNYGEIKEGHFLHEPEVSLLKAGAFALPVVRFGVQKIHGNSHLYVSSTPAVSFPGRSFRVHEIIPFTSSNLRQLALRYPRANMTVRNFQLSVEQWRKKTGIRDGGTDTLIGTTAYIAGKEVRIMIYATKWEETI